MVRPKFEHPTPGELEILQVIWDDGPRTVRQVMDVLNKKNKRAYTSIMSLMNVMFEKGLLRRKPLGRAYLYDAKQTREKTLSKILNDVVNRAFEGSASTMVAHLLNETKPSVKELDAIRTAIEDFKKGQ